MLFCNNSLFNRLGYVDRNLIGICIDDILLHNNNDFNNRKCLGIYNKDKYIIDFNYKLLDIKWDEDNQNKELFKNLKIDCEKCFGFCCVALYFSKFEGFTNNKEAGKPCENLKSNFSCSIHKEIRKQGLKGRTSYDYFGAGKEVAQVTYNGRDWRKDTKLSN